MLAGLAVGLVLGGLGAVFVQQSAAMNPMAMVLGAGLTGAAFGGFVGSLSTV
jgi:hypothetical protein